MRITEFRTRGSHTLIAASIGDREYSFVQDGDEISGVVYWTNQGIDYGVSCSDIEQEKFKAVIGPYDWPESFKDIEFVEFIEKCMQLVTEGLYL